MFPLIFIACVFVTIVIVTTAIGTVVQDRRVSKEISRAGERFLARYRM